MPIDYQARQEIVGTDNCTKDQRSIDGSCQMETYKDAQPLVWTILHQQSFCVCEKLQTKGIQAAQGHYPHDGGDDCRRRNNLKNDDFVCF